MKIYIETMGCPKNHVDSEMFLGMLVASGSKLALSPEEADCIIINTCGFINDAKIESIDKIFEMVQYGKKLIVTGCLSQRYVEDLYEEIPEIDIIAGVNDYKELLRIITEKEFTNGQIDQNRNDNNRVKLGKSYSNENDIFISNSFDECKSEQIWKTRATNDKPWSRTIKISEGCENNCTYCIIPIIRGRYRSRNPYDILDEAKYMASQGVKELIIIGQDTTNYGNDFEEINYSLAKLLKELCSVDGIEWIRLMYCYEDKITEELIDVIAEEEKICKYIDMPLQHISNPILKSMKRKSSTETIKNTLNRLREKVEGIHIRTTFIVGFPGESEEDFEELYEFVSNEKFERLGVFSYSLEEGTVAAKLKDQLDEEIKDARKNSIMNLQIDISRESNQLKVGKIINVIIEEEDEEPFTYIGRTQFDAPEIDNEVIIKSDRKLNFGEIIKVKINDAFDYDIVGTAL